MDLPAPLVWATVLLVALAVLLHLAGVPEPLELVTIYGLAIGSIYFIVWLLTRRIGRPVRRPPDSDDPRY